MTKITFIQPHIHAGIAYKAGDTIEVDQAAAAAIYAAGSAKPEPHHESRTVKTPDSKR